MSDNLAKITRNSFGFYTWRCSIDVDYYRKGMGMGVKACLGIAAFVLVFGGILAIQYDDWTSFLGYGKSSVYFDFDKAKVAIFTPKYIELQGRIKKIRVYVPEEDYSFVKGYIMSRLTGDCEIRYVS